MKKPRKPEVVEVRFRLFTYKTNAEIKAYTWAYINLVTDLIAAKLVRKPTVERVGKR